MSILFSEKACISRETSNSFFDTHAHLDLMKTGTIDEIIAEAVSVGVDRILVPSVADSSWAAVAMIADRFENVYPAFGIHPVCASEADENSIERLYSIAGKGIAIGECGIDNQCSADKLKQEKLFREQIKCAIRHNLPLLIHARGWHQRILQIMKEESAGQVGGIMHSFSGSYEMAMEFVRLGFAISFSGVITFENARKVLETASKIPLECMVIETDAPYQTPSRYRGTANIPSYLIEIAEKIAELRGVDVFRLGEILTENSVRFLRLG